MRGSGGDGNNGCQRSAIEEFLAAIVDGVPPEAIADIELPYEVGELLSELPAAIEYGLCGIQVWAYPCRCDLR